MILKLSESKSIKNIKIKQTKKLIKFHMNNHNLFCMNNYI